MNLSKEVVERIYLNAEKHSHYIDANMGYIVGATAEAERAQGLVKGLVEILEELNIPEVEDAGQLLHNIAGIASNTLNEYHNTETPNP